MLKREKGYFIKFFNNCTICKSISFDSFAETLSEVIEAKDKFTARHSIEVGHISQIIARTLGLSGEQVEEIHIAGHFHDIGKVAIPENILNKPGKLTPLEWSIVKIHPVIGAKILRPLRELREIPEIVLFHHERYDGNGYPCGLKGEEIPIGARIIAVADALSAMVKGRPYKRAINFDQALYELRKNSSTQFDPEIVEAVFEVSLEIEKILEKEGGDR